MFRQPLLVVHLYAVVAWVGGMFFAYFCLRPAAVEVLAPPQRLPLWRATFARFLPMMAVAVALLLASGFTLLGQAGFATAPVSWQIMATLGTAMAAIFFYVWRVLYPRLVDGCAAQAWPAAGEALNGIRHMVAVNLALGGLTIVAALWLR